MGRQYRQLTLGERHRLFQLREAGLSIGAIAAQLGRHRATLYRELARNCRSSGAYLPETAQRFAWARRLRGAKIERRSRLGAYVRDRLAMGWSPEQIAGRLRREQAEHTVSRESIYRWIYGPIGRRERLHRRGRPPNGRTRCGSLPSPAASGWACGLASTAVCKSGGDGGRASAWHASGSCTSAGNGTRS